MGDEPADWASTPRALHSRTKGIPAAAAGHCPAHSTETPPSLPDRLAGEDRAKVPRRTSDLQRASAGRQLPICTRRRTFHGKRTRRTHGVTADADCHSCARAQLSSLSLSHRQPRDHSHTHTDLHPRPTRGVATTYSWLVQLRAPRSSRTSTSTRNLRPRGSDPYLTSRNVVDTGGLPTRGALLARNMGYRHLAQDSYVSRGTRHDAEGSAGTMTPGITVDVARADTPNVSRATVLAMLSTRRLMLRQLGVTPMPVHWSRRRTHLPRKPRATARGDARFHAKHGVRSRHVFPGHEAEGSERAGDMVLPPAPPQSQYGRRDGKGTGKIGRSDRAVRAL